MRSRVGRFRRSATLAVGVSCIAALGNAGGVFASLSAFTSAHRMRATPVAHARETVIVRISAVAGDFQSARAFAASTGPGYETAFPRPLVVRVVAPRDARDVSRTLRFSCVRRDCRFALAEEGDDVTRVDARSYDVRTVHGRATLPLTLSTDRVPGTFAVRVRALVRPGERASAAAIFHLEVR